MMFNIRFRMTSSHPLCDFDMQPSRLSQQEHVDDVERAVGRRTPRLVLLLNVTVAEVLSNVSYSLSSQDEGTDEQSSIQYADSIHIQCAWTLFCGHENINSRCRSGIYLLQIAPGEGSMHEYNQGAEGDFQPDVSLAFDVKFEGKISFSGGRDPEIRLSLECGSKWEFIGQQETNEGKLTALEAENEMLRKKIAEMEQERVADKLKVAQPSNGFSPAPIAS
eukprot:760327-Hanusia_phi.AAC.13